MKNIGFRELLLRYLSNDLTDEETRQLFKYFSEGDQGMVMKAIEEALRDDRYKSLAERSKADTLFKNIIQQADKQNKASQLMIARSGRTSSSPVFRWSRFAAAAMITIMMGAGVYYTITRQEKASTAQKVKPNIPPERFIRYLTLPDGSTAVLQANSTLEYPASFPETSREVKLTGEAYFNIRHDAAKPFIIHTGNVKTTVLGTAFNVKAIPGTGQIIVSVAKGKVKVEDDRKMLAVLLPNQQVVYSTMNETAVQKQVNSSKIITDWTNQDLVFKSDAMSEIVETLSKRYGTKIIIRNPLMQQCLVTISFSGTDPLNDVLAALCTLTNASVIEQNDNEVIIDGEECNNEQ